MLLLAILPSVGLPPRADAILRVSIVSIVLVVVGRSAIDLRVRFPLGTLAVGVGVFAIWVAPDLLIPGWRAHPAFQNSLTGTLTVSMTPEARSDVLVIVLRLARAAILVPILEELFWRGWLPRFLDAKTVPSGDFRDLPLGHFSTTSFVATAVLFAAEHGPFWEVGLVAGLVYNWWMQRTRSLGDLIAAHALTNLVLGLFVLKTGRWEFWN